MHTIGIYSSMIQGLADSREALSVIKGSGLLSGIETTEIAGTPEKIRNAGLKYSIHDPHLDGMNNLANPELPELFRSGDDAGLLHGIRAADAPVIGFHCGFAAAKVFKMKAFSDIPVFGTLYTVESDLYDQMMINLAALEEIINGPLPVYQWKCILIESMDYIRPLPVDWSIQSDEVIRNRKVIEETIHKIGVNAGYRFVHKPSFLRSLLHPSNQRPVPNTGFLWDISHNFITADSKIAEGSFAGTIEDYFEEVLKAVGTKTMQIHVNVPSGDSKSGYLDHHLPFKKKDALSDRILELTRFVVKNAPELKVITLEISGGPDPVIFARDMALQAKYFVQQVFE
ncbi:MAG TPA: hypothetical protein VLR52_03470 [Bacteroidales bacterium]|nr:hypothetical protein [Bacteroidales bacterium]